MKKERVKNEYVYSERLTDFKQNDLKILIPIKYSLFSKKIDNDLKSDTISIFQKYTENCHMCKDFIVAFFNIIEDVYIHKNIRETMRSIFKCKYYIFDRTTSIPIDLVSISGRLYMSIDIMMLIFMHIKYELIQPSAKADRGYRLKNSMDLYNISKNRNFKFFYANTHNNDDIEMVAIKNDEHLTIYIEDAYFLKDIHSRGTSSPLIKSLIDVENDDSLPINRLGMKIFKNQ